MSDYPDKICHLQLNSGQIILFRLKSQHFRTYFLYMIRSNNVSQPVHDLPPHDPMLPPRPAAQNLGVSTPSTPPHRIDAYVHQILSLPILNDLTTPALATRAY